MNRYTPEQISDLIQEMYRHPVYMGQMLYMFSVKSFSEDKGVQFHTVDTDLYDRMRNFKWKKVYGGNRPSKEMKQMSKKIRDIIFEVPFEMVPLHISDPITGPIAIWRLRNVI